LGPGFEAGSHTSLCQTLQNTLLVEPLWGVFCQDRRALYFDVDTMITVNRNRLRVQQPDISDDELMRTKY